MKRSVFLQLSLVCIWIIGLSGCLEDSCTEQHTFYSYEPIYASMDDLRQQVAVESARDLKRPGKIYFYGQYILINEANEGYHIIDNTDPSNPRNITFIRVPGARDMAVKDNVLYADSYLDLVAIDISNPQYAQEVGREENVFAYGSYHPGLWAEEARGIAVDWIETEMNQEWDCSTNNWGRNVFLDDFGAPFASNSESFSSSPTPAGSAGPTGIGGSMARFTLVGNYLYCVTDTDLLPFDISDLTNPSRGAIVNIGWGGIETIFPMKDHLFIGSQTGMFVYSLNNPASPSYVSDFQHVRSCDPVVVEGEYAYVTLRNGAGETNCGGFANELNVINISNINNPILEHRYDMHNPHGLGIKDGVLFICDGDEGLKVYDASDVSEIHRNRLAHFKNIHAFDVIPLTNILLMIGEDGFYQYDYSDLDDIHEISMIPVVQD